MGRIVKKVSLSYDIFTSFIVFVDVHILLTLVHEHSLCSDPLSADMINGWPLSFDV